MRKSASGFTIVELLIVVVVIAILVAITVVAFNGIQTRARDNIRLSDVTTIRKAIEAHKAVTGQIPAKSTNATCLSSTWEQSKRPVGHVCENEPFIGSLGASFSKLPAGPGDTTSYYRYNVFSAGTYGCPLAKGAFYVITAVGIESGNGIQLSDTGACGAGFNAGINHATPSNTHAVFIGTEL